MQTFSAFGSTGWQTVGWKYKYIYPNGDRDANTYLKYYFTDNGNYDVINAYYTSGGDSTVVRAATKDAGGQIIAGDWASSSSKYNNTSFASQGAQKGFDFAKWQLKY